LYLAPGILSQLKADLCCIFSVPQAQSSIRQAVSHGVFRHLRSPDFGLLEASRLAGNNFEVLVRRRWSVQPFGAGEGPVIAFGPRIRSSRFLDKQGISTACRGRLSTLADIVPSGYTLPMRDKDSAIKKFARGGFRSGAFSVHRRQDLPAMQCTHEVLPAFIKEKRFFQNP